MGEEREREPNKSIGVQEVVCKSKIPLSVVSGVNMLLTWLNKPGCGLNRVYTILRNCPSTQ